MDGFLIESERVLAAGPTDRLLTHSLPPGNRAGEGGNWLRVVVDVVGTRLRADNRMEL